METLEGPVGDAIKAEFAYLREELSAQGKMISNLTSGMDALKAQNVCLRDHVKELNDA